MSEGKYGLKRKAGKNLLLFRVKGKVDRQYVYIKENEEGNMIVRSDERLTAVIRENIRGSPASITMEDDVKKNGSVIFAVTVLMFFMFKLYKRSHGISRKCFLN